VKWRGLYFGDHLTDMQRARGAVRSLAVALSSPAKPGTPLPPVGPALWCVLHGTVRMRIDQNWRLMKEGDTSLRPRAFFWLIAMLYLACLIIMIVSVQV
jgi:hypothetical protein